MMIEAVNAFVTDPTVLAVLENLQNVEHDEHSARKYKCRKKFVAICFHTSTSHKLQ